VTVYLVGAGPGDPGLLTRRGAQVLSEADVVIFDRLVHESVVKLAPASAELINVGKRPDADESSTDRQDEINRLLVAHGQLAEVVVRLKGGDPFVFGRGGEEVEVLARAGVAWEIVPGVTSAFGVPGVVGIPVTHRGLSSTVTVVTGRVGDHSAPGVADWEALAKLDGTLVIVMGIKTRTEIADALIRGGKPANTPVAVIERGTTSRQRVARTVLDRLGEVDLGSPAVIVVGAVAALGAPGDGPVSWAPLLGATVVVTRSGPRAHGLVDALEEAGAEVLAIPLTRQVDPADGGAALREAVADMSQYRWVVLTSVNAVQRFMGSLRDARAIGAALVAAVGPGTADALRAAGVEPDLVPDQHWAPGLVQVFPDADSGSGGVEVLFPCVDIAPPTIEAGLGEKGWRVRRVVAYRTVALDQPNDRLLTKMAQADAVTFSASSAVEAYVVLCERAGHSVALAPLAVCIGATTGSTAQRLGLVNVAIAQEASTEGIVNAVISHLGHDRPGDS